MKRTLALTLAAVLVLLTTACASGSQTTPSGGQSSKPSGSSQSASSRPESTAPAQGKTGVGMALSLQGTRGATADIPARTQAEITVCAATFAQDGTILDIMFDVMEPTVNFDAQGALQTDLAAAIQTKRQLGSSYGLKGASAIGKEWYEQADALQQWMTGQKAEEVLGMKTKTVSDSKYADEADLTSSVTIAVGQFLQALQSAYDNARGAGTMAGGGQSAAQGSGQSAQNSGS